MWSVTKFLLYSFSNAIENLEIASMRCRKGNITAHDYRYLVLSLVQVDLLCRANINVVFSTMNGIRLCYWIHLSMSSTPNCLIIFKRRSLSTNMPFALLFRTWTFTTTLPVKSVATFSDLIFIPSTIPVHWKAMRFIRGSQGGRSLSKTTFQSWSFWGCISGRMASSLLLLK